MFQTSRGARGTNPDVVRIVKDHNVTRTPHPVVRVSDIVREPPNYS